MKIIKVVLSCLFIKFSFSLHQGSQQTLFKKIKNSLECLKCSFTKTHGVYKGYLSIRSIKRSDFLMTKTKAIIKIQNVVASVTLNQKIDLNAVVKGYPSVEYNPEQFPGLVLRLAKGKTALIFSSGKIVCTGAKSEHEVGEAVNNPHSLAEEPDAAKNWYAWFAAESVAHELANN